MILLARLWFRVLLSLLMGGVVTLPDRASALTDYRAGKSSEQLFHIDCSGCHSSPSRLAQGRSERSLAGFLRAHYTTNAQSAASLANYLIRAPATGSTGNSFLKVFWKIWRQVSTASRWLIEQIDKVRAHLLKNLPH